MIGRNYEHQLILRYGADGQRGIGDLALDETKVRGTVVDHGCHRLGVAERQGERDAGIARLIAVNQARQPVVANGLTGRKAERAAL